MKSEELLSIVRYEVEKVCVKHGIDELFPLEAPEVPLLIELFDKTNLNRKIQIVLEDDSGVYDRIYTFDPYDERGKNVAVRGLSDADDIFSPEIPYREFFTRFLGDLEQKVEDSIHNYLRHTMKKVE